MRAMEDKCPLRFWRRLEKNSSKSLQTKAELHPHTAWTNHLGEALYSIPPLLLTPLPLCLLLQTTTQDAHGLLHGAS